MLQHLGGKTYLFLRNCKKTIIFVKIEFLYWWKKEQVHRKYLWAVPNM